MPETTVKHRLRPVPLMKLHKATGQSYVYYKGKIYYFGKFGTNAASDKYMAWRANLGKRVAEGYLIRELIAAYKKENQTRKCRWFIARLEAEMSHFLGMTCNDFGPLAFREVRKLLASSGTRTAETVNSMANVLRLAFKHGVSIQICNADVHDALLTVPPLKPDEVDRKAKGRVCVAKSTVEATLPLCALHVRHAIQLQLQTGARPNEILSIRKSAIAKDGPHATWVYRPIQHKSSHKGKKRFLVFGSEGQALIEAQSSLHPDSDWLFPSKRFNSHYKPEGYCHAVTQAAKLAGVPHWTPYQLRHIAATGIAVEKGLEAAAAVLGHVSMQTTGTYQHQPDAKQIRDATGHTEPKPNLVAELERLAALKERGLLTAEEFTLAKGKLLC